MKKQISLRAKLILIFLGVGLIPLLASNIISFSITSKNLKHDALTIAESVQTATSENIYELFSSEFKTLNDYAEHPSTAQALKEFSEVFEKVEKSSNNIIGTATYKEHKATVLEFYKNVFSPAYKEKTGEDFDYNSVVNKLDWPTLIAQYDFIAKNDNPLGKKDELITSTRQSPYSSLHQKYHPIFNSYQKRHGLYDVFLVNKDGRIVYSVFKETDFATSLMSGPWANTGLATAFKGSKGLPQGQVYQSDFESYSPSYEAPASFAATPIYEGSEYLGSLIVQFPVDKLNVVNTKRAVLGATGEILIVGQDKKLRVNSHRNAKTHSLDAFFKKNSSLTIDNPVVQKALNGESGTTENVSYDGVETIASYAPLKIANLNWAVVAELPKSEVLAGLRDLKKSIFIILTLSCIIICVVAYIYGQRISQTINSIVDALKDTTHRVAESSSQSASSATVLSEAATQQAASLQQTMASIEEISAMVSQNADYSEKVLVSVNENKKISDEGSKSMSEMMGAIDDIKSTNDKILEQMETSNKEFAHIVQIITDIGEKTKVINDIVFQTKLLSFNASVEAARAGEHGKGFAVVAEEVGNLAQMSGNAAKQITDMLGDSIKKVNEIVASTRQKVDELIEVGKDKIAMGQSTAIKSKEILSKITESAQSMSTMISEIAHASKEQAQGVQEINKAISELDKATQQNASVAQMSSTQAEQLSAQSQALQKTVDELVLFVSGHTEAQGGIKDKDKKEKTDSNVYKLNTKTQSQSLATPHKKVSGSDIKTPNFEEF